jgi:hypothetical protein
LTKKGFEWDEEETAAFQSLKLAMICRTVLGLPDSSLPFFIETDACDFGVGAVLMQNGHPIAYMSKTLGVMNKKLSIYEKEFFIVLMAVEQLRQYLQHGSLSDQITRACVL